MLLFNLLVFLIGTVGFVIGSNNCDHFGTLFYETLACNPVFLHDKKCPAYYDCEDYTINPNECNFRGRVYKEEEYISDQLMRDKCGLFGCQCTSSWGISCGYYDCRSFLEPNYPPDGNYLTYKLGQCCETGYLCNNCSSYFCNVDGATYKEQQRYESPDSCDNCVCDEKQDGTHCQRKMCYFEMESGEALANFCAPFYDVKSAKKPKCCPSRFICPTTSDVIQDRKKCEVRNTGGRCCRFGGKTIQPSQTVIQRTQYLNVTCVCDMPPYLTCYSTQK